MFLCLTNANVGIHNLIILLAFVITKANVLTECKHCPGFSLTNANVVLTESKHCTVFSALKVQMLAWQNPDIVLASGFLCLTNANVGLTESKHGSGFSALQMQMSSWHECFRRKMFLCVTNATVGIHNLMILLASVITKANVFLTESKHWTGFSALQKRMLSWQNQNIVRDGFSALQMQMLAWQNPNMGLVSLLYKYKRCPERIQTWYWFLPYRCKCCPDRIKTML